MIINLPTVGATEQVTTASEIVRHFGLWQERAARAPVYILHRGRARHVLTSVDLMQALCTGEGADTQNGIDGQPLLDGTSEAIVVAGSGLRVRAANPAARALFGAGVGPGSPIEALAEAGVRPLFAEALSRVRSTGRCETAELPSPRDPGRSLVIRLHPLEDGMILFVEDRTIEDERDAATAAWRSVLFAIEAVPGGAIARINLRGHLDTPSPSLAALTGVSASALNAVRFVSLFDIADRVAVGEAMEAVFTDGGPRSIDAAINVNRGSPRPVSLALAPLHTRMTVTGLTALLVPAGS